MGAHRHRRGAWQFGIGAKTGNCAALEWVLCPPDVAFERRVTRAPLSFYIVRFEWDVMPADCPLVGWNAPRDRARLAGDFALWRELHGRSDAASECVRQHVLSDILRLGWQEKLRPATTPRAPDAPMEAARAWLEKSAGESISITKLAATHRLSPVAFTRRFRAATGQAPSEFLIHCRLERARDLLLDTDLTLDTIAARSGFGNGFYLSRVWSKKWGGTPSGFRHTHRI